MFSLYDSYLLPAVFFILLAVSLISALLMLHPWIPLSFVRIHVGILTLPPIAALTILVTDRRSMILGPWQLNSLSWLLALFVLTIGLIVQRFSIRYLLGDRSYRKYFTLLTFTTVADSVAWLSDDLRLMLICWGATLLGLTFLIRLKKEWHVAKSAAAVSGRLFVLSWTSLLFAIVWVTESTGHWQLSSVLTHSSLAQLGSWEKTCINLLLVAAVIIPAAQWPFQRWLLDSAVAPTPISAVMHAGIVNAGGIMLTRFAPLFNGSSAQVLLLILSSISVIMGTGIMLVHVDYKRQLVGSTIAQMGFMLIQCALGAFLAAIIHAVLHGLFKSTLFLQSGSAVQKNGRMSRPAHQMTSLWILTGAILGILAGVSYWMSSPNGGYQWISTLILGWSVALAWSQLVAFESGHIGRITGIFLFTGAAIVYNMIHNVFYGLLRETVERGTQPPSAAIFLLFVMLAGSVSGAWLSRNRSTTAFTVVYLWLIQLGEPHKDLVESHPKYLTQSLSQGGNVQ